MGAGDDLDYLGSRACRHLTAEPDRLGHEFGVGASSALVRACLRLESPEPVSPVGGDPAVDRRARDETFVAVGRYPRPCRQGAHHKAALGGREPVAHGL